MTDEDQGNAGVSIKPNVDNYVTARTPAGSISRNCGDPVANALVGLTVEAVVEVADALIEPDLSFKEKYAHLNPGQVRMACGNRLRAWVRKGEEGEDRIETLEALTEKHRAVIQREQEEAAAAKAEAKAAKKAEAA